MSFMTLTITTPITINTSPKIVAKFGTCLYLKTPINAIAIIPTPDQVA